MADKTNQVQIRFTDAQLLYIDRAHQHYQQVNDEITTRSEFMRRMIMISCLMELGIVKVGKEDDPDFQEIKSYSCACVEVHTCGRENK